MGTFAGLGHITVKGMRKVHFRKPLGKMLHVNDIIDRLNITCTAVYYCKWYEANKICVFIQFRKTKLMLHLDCILDRYMYVYIS